MQPDGRPPQPPVTRDMLELLHIGLDDHIPENACILAAAETAFWTQSRLGELFTKNRSTFDPRRVPARSHLSPPSTLNGSRTLFYPYTKMKRYAGDKSSVTRQLGKSNPIESLRIHLARNHAANDSPLFSFFTRTGDLVCLTKRHFLTVCNRIWKSHDIPHTTGHSFRIGGTTELLMKGVDPNVVKIMGRWSSNAFLRYWRQLEIIIPHHAQLLGTSFTSFLTMNTVSKR
ncbi:hypothetical protein SCP_1601570 [Sparassis crispa]|uniref:Tyr recombinase domain-containing protein n=1 Tax=Sparassis crispa TaxID=139825 RepID=A0A401H4X3_9APHY|nr:hypothetical protein SCP_1601570 [Sparassis crispa]GBE89495.1 hypothetical protein SCP_1601570 [Sparassis crispa]